MKFNRMRYRTYNRKCFKALLLLALMGLIIGLYVVYNINQNTVRIKVLGLFPLRQNVCDLYKNSTRFETDLSRPWILDELRKLNWSYSFVSHTHRPIADDAVRYIDEEPEKASGNISQYNIYSPQKVVPNIIHYVWLGNDLTFKFIHYITYLSVHRFIRPQCILVYGSVGPTGPWWQRTIREVDNIYHVVIEGPATAFNGKAFRYLAHKSDVLRAQLVQKFGGIYLDSDVMVLKSFDPLRHYRATMGVEDKVGLCNGILIAERNASFIGMLLDQYYNYSTATEIWNYKSVIYPYILSTRYPHLIHVEKSTLHTPSWFDRSLIYDNIYDWSKNYAMHLWIRSSSKVPNSTEAIQCANTTIGEISRYVLYGNKTLRCA